VTICFGGGDHLTIVYFDDLDNLRRAKVFLKLICIYTWVFLNKNLYTWAILCKHYVYVVQWISYISHHELGDLEFQCMTWN
jgi:hypothetical protein